VTRVDPKKISEGMMMKRMRRREEVMKAMGV
jgi:hypothetical protein